MRLRSTTCITAESFFFKARTPFGTGLEQAFGGTRLREALLCRGRRAEGRDGLNGKKMLSLLADSYAPLPRIKIQQQFLLSYDVGRSYFSVWAGGLISLL